MKQIDFTVLLFVVAFWLMGCMGGVAPSEKSSAPVDPNSSAVQVAGVPAVVASEAIEETSMNQIMIEVGSEIFSATLADNEAARTFAGYLPMTVQMGDLNGQEKFCALPDNLFSVSTERPFTIQSGDIFCWSGNTLVLFYTTFQNSYGGYVRLGTVDDAAGLAEALGSGSVEVIWSLA